VQLSGLVVEDVEALADLAAPHGGERLPDERSLGVGADAARRDLAIVPITNTVYPHLQHLEVER